MSQVYANSILTISATKSSGSEDGFLEDRAITEVELGTYQTSDEGEYRSLGLCVYQHGHSMLGPLNDRAWTLQERFLSPAILHYTTTGMVWECKSLCILETGQLEGSNPILKAIQLTDSTDAESY
jgi:hypothetical protein